MNRCDRLYKCENFHFSTLETKHVLKQKIQQSKTKWNETNWKGEQTKTIEGPGKEEGKKMPKRNDQIDLNGFMKEIAAAKIHFAKLTVVTLKIKYSAAATAAMDAINTASNRDIKCKHSRIIYECNIKSSECAECPFACLCLSLCCAHKMLCLSLGALIYLFTGCFVGCDSFGFTLDARLLALAQMLHISFQKF